MTIMPSEKSEAQAASPASNVTAPSRRSYIPGLRWWMCALLFLATTINYVDRNALSVLKTTLERQLNWSEADYGWIAFAFTTAYAIFPSFMGRIVDAVGVKIGFAGGLIVWSVMAAAHALVTSVFGFASARFLLGAAESINFPAAIKAVAQWFPQKERALATGLFNSGTNVGVMISFGTVMLATAYGWRWAFVMIGVIGFGWLALWIYGFQTPERHARLSPAEHAYIRADRPAAVETVRVHWTTLLRYGNIWPFLLGKFMTDPVWWFYLYWLPSYLEKERGRNPLKSALLLVVIYTGASVGSIVGGWFSGFLIGKGWRVGPARYLAMLLAAVCMPGSIIAYYTQNFGLCIALISLATACHQGWSANIFTSATDIFPSKVAGSVIGLGTTAGAIGGMFMTLLAGMSIQWLGTQKAVFIWAGLMHPLCLIIYRLWIGRDFQTIDVDQPLDTSRRHSGLLAGGAILGLLGLALALLIYANWEACVAAAKLAGAAQAATAAVGVLVIGLVLLYAGKAHRAGATAV
jgi:ACS family hexuronate transporter-like MFS transporter